MSNKSKIEEEHRTTRKDKDEFKIRKKNYGMLTFTL